MNLIREIQSRFSATLNMKVEGFTAWRERVLDLLLLAISTLGVFALLVNLIPVIQIMYSQSGALWWLVILYVLAYLWILILTFKRGFPYLIRAGTIVLFPFAAAVTSLWLTGLSTDAITWLFISIFFASILFGLRYTLLLGAVEVAVLAVFGLLITTGTIPVETVNVRTDSSRGLAWFITAFDLVYLSSLAIGALLLFLDGLTKNLQSAQEFSTALTKGLLRPATIPSGLVEAEKLEEVTSSLERTQALLQIGQVLTSFDEPVKVFQAIVQKVVQVTGADHSVLITLDTENELVTNYIESDKPPEAVVLVPYKELLDGLTGWALRERKPAVSPKDVPDFRESESVQRRRRDVNAGSMVVSPLVYRDRVLGTLSVTRLGMRPDFNAEEIDLIVTISNQVATSLANVELFGSQQKRAIQLQTAAEVSQASASILDPNQLLPAAVERIREGFNLYYAGIFLLDETQEWAVLRAGTGEAGKTMLANNHRLKVSGESMIGRTVATSQAQIAQEVGEATTRFKNPLLPDTRAEMALPLVSRGQTIGAMTIQSTQANAFAAEDITTLQTMADQLATSIQNAELFEATENRARELSVLNRLAAEVTRSFRVEEIAQTILESVRSLFGAEYIAVVIPQPSGRLQVVSSVGMSERTTHLINRSTVDTDYWKLSLKHEVLIAENTENAPIDPLLTKLLMNEGVRSFVFLPLRTQDRVIGALNIGHARSGAITERSGPLLRTLGDQIALVLENALLFENQERRSAQLSRLYDVSVELGQQQTELNSLLDLLTQRAMTLLNADGGGIWLWREAEQNLELVITYQVGDMALAGRRLKPGEGLTGLAYSEKRRQVIDNYAVWEKRPENFQNMPFAAAMAIPMFIQEEVLGALVLTRSQVGQPFTQDEQELAELLSNQASASVQTARSYKDLRAVLKRTQALLQVGQALIALEEPVKLFQTTVEILADVTQADQVLLITFDFENQRVNYFVESGKTQDEVLPLSYNELLQGLSGWAVREGKPAISPKLIPDPRESEAVQKHRISAGVGSIIVVPMKFRDTVLGTLTATKKLEAPDFSNEDIDLILALASQVSTAIENVELYSTQQKRARQLQAAAEVSQAASSVLDLAELLPKSVELIRDSFDLYYVGIFLADDQNEWADLRAGTGEAGRVQLERHHRLKIGGNSMIGQAISNGIAQIAQEVGEAEVRFRNPLLPDTRSEMALPLVTRGLTIGSMTIQSTHPAAFSIEDITTLQTMANQLANAIQNALFFEQTRQQNLELSILNEMGRALSNMLDTVRVGETLYQYTSRLMDTTNFFVALYDSATDEVTFPVVINENERIHPPTRRLGNGISDYIVRNAKPMLFKDFSIDRLNELGIDYVTIGDTAPALSWLGVPMMIGSNVIGTIVVQSITTRSLYQERHLDLLTSIASQASIAFQNAQFFKQTQIQNLELATLNEMSRTLGTLFEVDRIVETTYEYTSMLMDTTYYFFALYDQEQESVSFPLVMENGVRSTIAPIKKRQGLTQHVIDTKQPLLITHGVNERIDELGLERITVGAPAESWLGVPVLVGENVIGVMAVQNADTPGMFSERHQELLVSIARQASIAIQNAQLFQQTQRQAQELEVLNEMGRTLTALLDLNEVLDATYQFTMRLMPSSDAFVTALYHVDTEMLEFPMLVEQGEPLTVPSRRRTGTGLTEHVIINKKPLLIESDVTRRTAELGIKMVTAGQEALSWMGVPLLINSSTSGMLSVQSVSTANLYKPRDLELLTSIANQTSIAIQNVLLFQETQKTLLATEQLYQASSAISAAQTYQEVIQALRQFSALGKDPEALSIDLFDAPFTPTHRPEIIRVLERWNRTPQPGLSFTYSLADYPSAPGFMAPDRPTVLGDIQTDARIDEALRRLFTEDLKATSTIFIPLRSRGEWIGYINGQYDHPITLTPEEETGLMPLADQATIAIQGLYQLEQIRSRVRREQILSEVTAKVHSATDVDAILRTAAQEVGRALGRNAFIYLGNPATPPEPNTQPD